MELYLLVMGGGIVGVLYRKMIRFRRKDRSVPTTNQLGQIIV